ncbi:hypothetical protein KM799_05915 [Clostridium tyrobutyricum]|uniref:hypothetical protein n=1 Tax=Clostridium tyrobutyricum TaxID=1519 RepID=UPI00057D5BB4|nr:hypothetical protein [Clostridium tyrobutyricum]MBV4446134.1 hypothetical protein [Clostridium tyrobutyricum]
MKKSLDTKEKKLNKKAVLISAVISTIIFTTLVNLGRSINMKRIILTGIFFFILFSITQVVLLKRLIKTRVFDSNK